MQQRLTVWFLLLTFTVLISPRVAEAQREPVKGLNAYVQKAMAEWEVPGLAVAIVKGDTVIFAKGYGVRTIGETAPVDERTVFAVASTTKAMTAALMGMLVDEGKLSWDDPVTKHLPGFQLFDPYVTREITVRDLLTHRSGLPRGDLIWYASERDREEVIRRARLLKPAWSFRSRYGYQNIMYVTAGEVIKAVTGRTWDEFIHERLFAPLGMHSSVTSTSKLASMPNVATPHGFIDGRIETLKWRNVDNVGAAGSVNSSAFEMAQWVRLNLNDGVYGGRRLLSSKTIKEMQSPQTIIPIDSLTEALTPSTHFMTYGLGWTLHDYHGRKVVRHDGALDGMRTRIAMIPEEKLGLVLLTNQTRTGILTALMYRVFDAFLGAPERDWSAVFLKILREQEAKGKEAEEKRAMERAAGTKTSLPLEHYAGSYENEMYGTITISVENGRLVGVLNPSYVADLEHWHFDTFHALWRDRSIGKSFMGFTLNAQGKAEVLQWENIGEFRRSN